jgi:hypothetical protein
VSDSEPLFSQPIAGVRAWEVTQTERDGPLLGAWAVGQIWQPGGPVRATCVARALRRPRPNQRSLTAHLAPDPDCACGIYALHPQHLGTRVELLERLGRCDPAGVLGAIESWGRIEVHRDGFRAEWARVTALYRTGADGEVSAACIARLAEAYGARVVDLRDGHDLSDELAEAADGLGRGVVATLLADRQELILEPSSEVAFGRHGERLQSSGLRPSQRARRGQPRSPRIRRVRFTVAGASRRAALQDERFNLCREVTLLPVPSREPGGPPRIGVWDRLGEVQVGWVPAPLATRVERELARGAPLRALVIWQERDVATGRRTSITVLVTPQQRIVIELRPRARQRTLIPIEAGEDLF